VTGVCDPRASPESLYPEFTVGVWFRSPRTGSDPGIGVRGRSATLLQTVPQYQATDCLDLVRWIGNPA